MKIGLSPEGERGLTLVELLVVIAVAAIFFPMIDFGAPVHAKARALRIQCINNLKQDGLATRVWEGDNKDKYPWHVAQTNGGTKEFTSGTNLWRDFQIMSNELSTPKVLICPADEPRVSAADFVFFNNSNISFFLGLDATETNPQAVLSGDRNLTNDTPIENGILKLTPNHAAGWTVEMHKKMGNILFADGSVQQLSETGLQNAIPNGSGVTNHLLMPVIGSKE